MTLTLPLIIFAINFDKEMNKLQIELSTLLKLEENYKKELIELFKELKHEIKFTNPNTNVENKVTLDGLTSFLG